MRFATSSLGAALAALAVPRPAAGGVVVGSLRQRAEPPTAPTVDSLTMSGPGCPLGAGGLVREMREGTPVFLFTEWGLSLAPGSHEGDAPASSAEPAGAAGENSVTSVSKWCSEEISLGNGAPGWQVRIGTVSVGGYAELPNDAVVGVSVVTKLGDVEAGTGMQSLKAADLKDGMWSVDVKTMPETWSPCVPATGKVPLITIRTSVSLNGTTDSGAVVGGAKTDMKKALSMHFSPEWRECA